MLKKRQFIGLYRRIAPGARSIVPVVLCLVLALLGVIPLLFFSSIDTMTATLAVNFAVGIAAVGLVTYLPVFNAVAVFLLTLLLPLSLVLFFTGEWESIHLGVAEVLFLAALLFIAHRAHRALWQSGVENSRVRGQGDRYQTGLAEVEDIIFRELVEKFCGVIVLVHDIQEGGRSVYANEAACDHFGVDMATLLTWVPEDYDDSATENTLKKLNAPLLEGQPVVFETEHRGGAGELIPVQVTLHPLRDNPRYVLAYIQDIRERRELESQRAQLVRDNLLRESDTRIRHLMETLPDYIACLDAKARCIYLSPKSRAAFDAPLHYDGKTLPELGLSGNSKADWRLHEQALQVIANGEMVITRERWGKGGRQYSLEVRYIPEKNREGEVTGLIIIARDFTARARMEEALTFVAQRSWSREGEPFLVALSRYLGEVLGVDYVIVDRLKDNAEEAETVAIFAKGEVLPNLGYRLEGTPCEGVMDGELCCYQSAVQRLFPQDQRLVDMGVESYIGLPLWDSDGRAIGLIAVMDSEPLPETADATSLLQLVATRAAMELEREHSERLLQYQANHDALTGLPNRWQFSRCLEQELARAERNDKHVALLFVDLDRFKEVNDTLGHEIGDRLLVEAARRIQSCVRQSDIVTRLGGDEFTVLAPGMARAERLVTMAQAIIEAMNQAFVINEHRHIYVTASIGIASYPLDAREAGRLLACADQAMYAAKERGRNHFCFFTAPVQERA